MNECPFPGLGPLSIPSPPRTTGFLFRSNDHGFNDDCYRQMNVLPLDLDRNFLYLEEQELSHTDDSLLPGLGFFSTPHGGGPGGGGALEL